MIKTLRTEQIQVRKSKEFSELCYKSKNLYNRANFLCRKLFFKKRDEKKGIVHEINENEKTLENFTYYELNDKLKDEECYRVLPSHVAQQTLKIVEQNWKSFWAAWKEYKNQPEKFLGMPKIPKCKKKNNEFIAIFTNQASRIKDGYLHFAKKSGLKPIKTRIQQFQLNNLITCVNNVKGVKPFIIKGGVVKSINQFYNKMMAKIQSSNAKNGCGFNTKRVQTLLRKRNNRIKDYFHKTSNIVIKECVKNNFGTLVIGYNEKWKQNVNIGSVNNQNFVQIPYYRLIQMLKYKAESVGIQVILQEESYTSKCSFLDGDTMFI